MTTYNKTTLKTFFEQGDIPTGTNYADLIDSQVNLVETALQTMAGPLACTELITPIVSANAVSFGGTTFNVNTTSFQRFIAGGNLTFGTAGSIGVSAASGSITASAANSINLTGDNGVNLFYSDLATGAQLSLGSTVNLVNKNGNVVVSAGGTLTLSTQSTLNLTPGALSVIRANGPIQVSADVSATGTIYASAMRSVNGLFAGVGIVSAAGTTQGAAAVLTNVINRGKGVADGSTTGFTPLANRAGLVQYLYNEGASANLWPPTGGTINGLAANAAFALATSAMVTIVHLTASAYAVK